MRRISKVTPLERFEMKLELPDGSAKTVDLAPYLRGPVFEPLRSDPEMFRAVSVDEELGLGRVIEEVGLGVGSRRLATAMWGDLSRRCPSGACAAG
jgi:hypothetical protein